MIYDSLIVQTFSKLEGILVQQIRRSEFARRKVDEVDQRRDVGEELVDVPDDHPRHVDEIAVLEGHILGKVPLFKDLVEIDRQDDRLALSLLVLPNDLDVGIHGDRCRSARDRHRRQDIVDVPKPEDARTENLTEDIHPLRVSRLFGNGNDVTVFQKHVLTRVTLKQ